MAISTLENIDLIMKITAAVALLASVGNISMSIGQKTKPIMKERIEEVENAIKSLNDLEKYLKTVKNDMLATQQAKELIEQEYEKIKLLQKLTEKELARINVAVNKISLKDKIKNIFWVLF
jgi:hypothetical protein